jgi:hypothetical protein
MDSCELRRAHLLQRVHTAVCSVLQHPQPMQGLVYAHVQRIAAGLRHPERGNVLLGSLCTTYNHQTSKTPITCITSLGSSCQVIYNC